MRPPFVKQGRRIPPGSPSGVALAPTNQRTLVRAHGVAGWMAESAVATLGPSTRPSWGRGPKHGRWGLGEPCANLPRRRTASSDDASA